MDANEFLHSKGFPFTRELININDECVNLIELLDEYVALSQHDVSNRREQLIAFHNWLQDNSERGYFISEFIIDEYIESN